MKSRSRDGLAAKGLLDPNLPITTHRHDLVEVNINLFPERFAKVSYSNMNLKTVDLAEFVLLRSSS